METHVTGQPVLGELRQHVLTSLLGNPLFTDAEQLRANHFVHECEDAARLTRWHANVLTEIAHREAAAARHRGRRALSATLKQLQPDSAYRGHHPRKRQSRPTLPAWVPGASFPDRADRHAGTFDRRAAACFQPADSLTLARLVLTRPQS